MLLIEARNKSQKMKVETHESLGYSSPLLFMVSFRPVMEIQCNFPYLLRLQITAAKIVIFGTVSLIVFRIYLGRFVNHKN